MVPKKSVWVRRDSQFADELNGCGYVDGDHIICDKMSECYRSWKERHRPPPPPPLPPLAAPTPAPASAPTPIEPIPYESWPRWVKWIAKRRQDGEAGVGDTVKRMLGSGGLAFQEFVRRRGFDCNCEGRRREYNAKYDYSYISNS